jgi:cysteinyl-tRNA synthetase
MGRTMQDFVPVTPGFVGFYGCGPTVYNYAHIGNLRAYVFLDTLDRTLTFLGYKKKHVMNITDIGHLTGDADDGEDKMLKTAQERHQSVLDVAKFYTDAFFSDLDALNIKRPDVVCKATDHIQEMIDLIKRIEANGHTYMAGGNLYYDVSTYPDYGKLANLNLDDLRAGAGKRDVVVVDQNKRSPYDFVLWFTKSKFENQALTWDSPWGRGYPGWHIECSAMSMKYLGEHFDIHTGGIDHVPIHHTNEIAQSEGATGKKWVNYWLHNEFLVIAKDNKATKSPDIVEATKMSKSTGNFLRLQTLIDAGYDPLDYRLFLLGSHYRKQVYFSYDAMDGAKNSRAALLQRIAKLAQNAGGRAALLDDGEMTGTQASDLQGLSEKARNYMEDFKSAMENDLATPKALSLLQKAVKDSSVSPEEALLLVRKMDYVLGLNLVKTAVPVFDALEAEKSALVPNHDGDPEAAEIDALIAERISAKKNKDFARADAIRDELTARGIVVTDTPNGPVWERK